MRLVIDTNIFVSGTFWGGTPNEIIMRVRNGFDVLLVSDEILDEIKDVFDRPKFYVFRERIKSTITDIEGKGEKISIPPSLNVADSGCRDPKDIRYLKCAVAGNADYIISGDKHLRELQVYQGIRIMSAREYLDIAVTR